jgi:hypothetical protein
MHVSCKGCTYSLLKGHLIWNEGIGRNTVCNKGHSKLDGIVTVLRLGRGLDFRNEK